MTKEIIGMSETEAEKYIGQIREKVRPKELKRIKIEADGDWVNIWYETASLPFERIRRITGYLVGTTERWNDAKRAELGDRVKHGEGEVEHAESDD